MRTIFSPASFVGRSAAMDTALTRPSRSHLSRQRRNGFPCPARASVEPACTLKEGVKSSVIFGGESIEDFAKVSVKSVHRESCVLMGPLEHSPARCWDRLKVDQAGQEGFMGLPNQLRWGIGPCNKDAEHHGVAGAFDPCLTQVKLHQFGMQRRTVKRAVPNDQRSISHLQHAVEIGPHVRVGYIEVALVNQPAQQGNG